MGHRSPLTIARMQDRELLELPKHVQVDPEFERQHRRWACPNCGGAHTDEYGAERCCPPQAIEIFEHPQTREHFQTAGELADAMAQDGTTDVPHLCPVCAHPADDNHDAAACCLWRDFGPLERFRIASAVDRGASWEDAIGAEERVAPTT